jgi:hypothetical protein
MLCDFTSCSSIESGWFQRLTLYRDELPLNFIFNLNLRRYTMAARGAAAARQTERGQVGVGQGRVVCVIPSFDPGDNRPWFQRLKLKHDDPLSNFAFIFIILHARSY